MIIGKDSFFAKMDNLSNTEKISEALDKSALLVQSNARTLCPVDTGNLRNSIVIEKKDNSREIGTSVEYAPYVEFGTGQKGSATNTNSEVNVSYRADWSGMKAQPYLYPALKDNKEKIQKIFKETIKK